MTWLLISLLMFLLVIALTLCLLTFCYYKARPYHFNFQNTSFNSGLSVYMKTNLEPYSPTFYLPGSFLKMLPHILPVRDYSKDYRRLIVPFRDGGQSALDIYPKSSTQLTNSTIVIFPGLNSTGPDIYIRETAIELYKTTGLTVAVFSRRGYSGVEVTGDYPFLWTHFEDCDDINRYLVEE